MDLTPRLSGEASIMAGLAAVGIAIGTYQAMVGPVSDVHATEAGDMNLQKSVRKAGWTAFMLIASVAVLAKDPNIMILGGGAIIIEELCYRHALMSNPHTGAITVTPAAYQPASGQAGLYVVGGATTAATAG